MRWNVGWDGGTGFSGFDGKSVTILFLHMLNMMLSFTILFTYFFSSLFHEHAFSLDY